VSNVLSTTGNNAAKCMSTNYNLFILTVQLVCLTETKTIIQWGGLGKAASEVQPEADSTVCVLIFLFVFRVCDRILDSD